MRLTWMNNDFICKDLYAPFVLDKDSDYLDDLKKKYNIVLKQAGDAGADEESLKILQKFKNKIVEALKCYYKADIEKCNAIIRNLIKDIGEDPFAVSSLKDSYAFQVILERKFSFLDVEWEIHLMLMWQKTCCICR